MILRAFVRAYRGEIDKHIRARIAGASGLTLIMRINDHDREFWVSNDESLYLWAKSLGVRL